MQIKVVSHWQEQPLTGLNWGEAAPPAFPQPEAALVAVEHERVLARCGLWWQETPSLEGEKPGLIGQYWAETGDAGVALLRAALDELAGKGLRKVIGPMDANTWHGHRWMTWSRGDTPFPMEPRQPARWVDDWRAAGFVPLAGYHSSASPASVVDRNELDLAAERLEQEGIHLRPIDKHQFSEELTALHALSLESFRTNFLYQPIDLATFSAMYGPLKDHYEPRASALAEDAQGLAGFLFAFPAPPAEESQAPRLVIKTLAVRGDRRGVGLGKFLVSRAHFEGRQAGFGQVVHALMQDENISTQVRADRAEIFRRYTLFVCDVSGL